jgi:hypothetical protein
MNTKKMCKKKKAVLTEIIRINLTHKPKELEEVVVISKIAFPHIGFNQEYADNSKIENEAKNPNPIGVYDGRITNCADLKRIARILISLLVKPKENKLKIPEVEFKKIIPATFNPDFFDKTLKIKPSEIALFLEFCDADLKSKTVLENSNPLKLLDFLLAKNIELKKLNAATKLNNKKAAKINSFFNINSR